MTTSVHDRCLLPFLIGEYFRTRIGKLGVFENGKGVHTSTKKNRTACAIVENPNGSVTSDFLRDFEPKILQVRASNCSGTDFMCA